MQGRVYSGVFERKVILIYDVQSLSPGRNIVGRISQPIKYFHNRIRKTIGVSRKVLSDVVNEKAGISPVMSLRLSKALNKSPQFWLTIQMNYDLFKVQKKSRKAIQAVRSVRWKTDKQKLAA